MVHNTQVITYKFQMKPSAPQERKFVVFAGQARFVWNQLLARVNENRANGVQQSLTPFGLGYEVPKLKREFEWLTESSKWVTVDAAHRLAKSFKRFFDWCKTRKGRKVGPPKFKSKRGTQGFTFGGDIKVRGNQVFIPKIGWVRFRKSRDVVGKIKTAVVKKSPGGNWFVSIVCDLEIQPLPMLGLVVGVDVGLTHYATLSTSEKIENPRWLRKSLRKLKRLQQSLNRKVKGSSNRSKARLAVAKLHERIANKRADFQHKLSTRLINENQVIGVESLNVAGLIKTRLAKSFGDAGLGAFLGMLKYKAEWYGRTVIEADQFFPSSKTCSACGVKNESLKLSDRFWQCECGASHDRDINAAINLRNVAAGHAETLNACGVNIRL